MDEEKDLEQQDSGEPADEDSDSQDAEQTGESVEEKIAKLEQANKELFARAKKAEEEAKTLKTTEKVEKVEPASPKIPDVEKLLTEKLEEVELAKMDVADDIKAEIKAYAKAKGVSVIEASKSDYIGFLQTKAEEKRKEIEASTSSKKSTGKSAKRDFANMPDEELRNLSDEEWEEAKEWFRKQG